MLQGKNSHLKLLGGAIAGVYIYKVIDKVLPQDPQVFRQLLVIGGTIVALDAVFTSVYYIEKGVDKFKKSYKDYIG